MSLFSELAYAFNHDNPFINDTGNKKLSTLKQNMKNLMKIDFSTMEDYIKYYDLIPELTQLYGDTTKKKKIYETLIINDFKDVISSFPQFKSFNTYLDKYGYIGNETNITGGNKEESEAEELDTVESNEEPEEQPEQKPLIPSDDIKYESIIPISPMKFDYKKTGGLTNYNITSDKPLSYDEIRKLTVNIARSKLKTTVEKSEQVLALERAKRKELMNNIQKYKNIKAIGVLVEDNIQDMDLSQLEHTLNTCEKLFQSQKLKETIKRGSNFGGLVFDTVFPEGIKITKTKRIRPKGIGKTVIDSLFDTQSTIGVAFQNIVDKHNWNITDEAVLMLSIGEMFISNLNIETVEEEKKEPKINEEKETDKKQNDNDEDNEEAEVEDDNNEEDGYEYYSEAA